MHIRDEIINLEKKSSYFKTSSSIIQITISKSRLTPSHDKKYWKCGCIGGWKMV